MPGKSSCCGYCSGNNIVLATRSTIFDDHLHLFDQPDMTQSFRNFIMERLVVAMLLFAVSSQAQALTKIDTGLGNPEAALKMELIKHFASLAEDEVGALTLGVKKN